MSTLTFEERCAWLRGMWDDEIGSGCTTALITIVSNLTATGPFTTSEFIRAFDLPEEHPEKTNAIFEKYLELKLIGEIP